MFKKQKIDLCKANLTVNSCDLPIVQTTYLVIPSSSMTSSERTLSNRFSHPAVLLEVLHLILLALVQQRVTYLLFYNDLSLEDATFVL